MEPGQITRPETRENRGRIPGKRGACGGSVRCTKMGVFSPEIQQNLLQYTNLRQNLDEFSIDL